MPPAAVFAGSVKFRLFSPMQALCSDAKSIGLPLQSSDTTESLLADPVKVAAAARQLDGRAVKLLPDERCVLGMDETTNFVSCTSVWYLHVT